MSEQTVTTSSAPKAERSNANVSCRLSYDCLMASTKSFVNNFNNLTPEEKLEFKSLNNYVKQLEKCMLSLRNNGQVKVPTVKRVTKSAPTSQVTVAPVAVTSVVQEATAPKGKGAKPKKASSKEVSPTAQVVEEVKAAQAAPVKRGKSGKQAASSPAQEEPVKEVAQKVAVAKKGAAKKSA